MKIIYRRFYIKTLLRFEICAREIWKKFVYKHLKTIEYVETSLLFQLHRQILGNKKAKLSGYCFCMAVFKSALVYF